MDYTIHSIGIAHTCFTEKFGIPRQSGLIPEAKGQIEILAPYDSDEAFRELGQFSHLWILFLFHQHLGQWQPTVRPPRLGGNARVGVFASRASFRPNPIGMSVVLNEGIERKNGKLLLTVSGVDFLDGTPVIDIKPYIPYADSIPDASAGYAQLTPARSFQILFSSVAEAKLEIHEKEHPGLKQLLTRLLELDPRPSYQAKKVDVTTYAMKLYDLDIHWHVNDNTIQVDEIFPAEAS